MSTPIIKTVHPFPIRIPYPAPLATGPAAGTALVVLVFGIATKGGRTESVIDVEIEVGAVPEHARDGVRTADGPAAIGDSREDESRVAIRFDS